MSAALGIDTCQYPAQAPPAGQTSNFVNPITLQPQAIAVGVVMTALNVVFTAIRVSINLRKLHLADYTSVLATLMSFVYTVISLVYSKYDRHQWDTPACWFNPEYLKFLYAQLTLYGPMAFFTKAAIFLMYLQFFGINRSLRTAVYVGLPFALVVYWSSVPVAAYYGAPHVGETWESLFVSLRPTKEAYWGVVQGAVSILLDVYIFILPLPILWKLQLDRTKRLQLFVVFGMALVAVAASCVAFFFRLRLLIPDKYGGSSGDSTWNQAVTSLAVLVENNVAIIVGCMPALAAFARNTIGESALFKSLQSKLLRTGPSKDSLPKPKIEVRTFGTLPQERAYMELREAAAFGSEVVIRANSGRLDSPQLPEPNAFGVWRSVTVQQDTEPLASPGFVEHIGR